MKTTFNSAVVLAAISLFVGVAQAETKDANEPEPKAEPSVIEKTGQGIERGAKATEKGIKRGAEATAHGIDRGVKATERVVRKVARKIGLPENPEKTGAEAPKNNP